MWKKARQFFKAAGGRGAPGAGERGERLAAEYLQREHGFQVIARNWRSPRDRRDEIDLVAHDGETLVFIEVKSRDAAAIVSGHHAVDRRKRKVLRRAIQAYLAGLRRKPVSVRLDVVEIALPGAGSAAPAEIRHFANLPLFRRHWRP